MMNLDNRLFCRLDGSTVAVREQRRMTAMTALGLRESESVPVFEEAVQTAAHFLDVPVCILGLMEQDYQRFKSSVGLSRLGLMNELATSRQCLRSESFCSYVVDSHQVLAIADTFTHPAFADSQLTQQHGVRAYLSVPLITASGFCIGTLAVMDLRPHPFTAKEIEFLELTARWSMSEFERQQTVKKQAVPSKTPLRDARDGSEESSQALGLSIASQLKIELLSQLTQELRTPLTSVMGMASVLTHEIYGPLTGKQKEYLGIIHHSGQYLLSLVNEILELSNLKDDNQRLNLTSIDIEMLCQQAINTLEQAAQRREQQIRLSVEPGRRIWLLDKDKVRQMLYHLVFSVIQSSNAGSIVRLHVSHRGANLTIAVWVSHPWLGEGLPYTEVNSHHSLAPTGMDDAELQNSLYEQDSLYRQDSLYEAQWETQHTAGGNTAATTAIDRAPMVAESKAQPANLNNNLGLLLSRQLAELHDGCVTIQGAPESGYRYVISLPPMTDPEAANGSA